MDVRFDQFFSIGIYDFVTMSRSQKFLGGTARTHAVYCVETKKLASKSERMRK